MDLHTEVSRKLIFSIYRNIKLKFIITGIILHVNTAPDIPIWKQVPNDIVFEISKS